MGPGVRPLPYPLRHSLRTDTIATKRKPSTSKNGSLTTHKPKPDPPSTKSSRRSRRRGSLPSARLGTALVVRPCLGPYMDPKLTMSGRTICIRSSIREHHQRVCGFSPLSTPNPRRSRGTCLRPHPTYPPFNNLVEILFYIQITPPHQLMHHRLPIPTRSLRSS